VPVQPRYPAAELTGSVAALFAAAGLDGERAATVAGYFLEADLLGYDSHGLARVPDNLEWLLAGETRRHGVPRVLAQRTAVQNWDAAFLPGPWVVSEAVRVAAAQVRRTGAFTIVLRRAQHAACLAAALVPLLDEGLVGLLMASTPSEAFVSPFGGHTPTFSNDPIAFAAPGRRSPLLFDISTAILAGGRIGRRARAGARLDEPALKAADGRPTDDPAVLEEEPPGSVMTLGGLSHGYKGTALALMAETLTQALGGYGRDAGANDKEANALLLQVYDPAAFGPPGRFLDEVDRLQARCRACAPDDPDEPVRAPGDAAWARRQRQLDAGVELHPEIMPRLEPWLERFGVAAPQPVDHH